MFALWCLRGRPRFSEWTFVQAAPTLLFDESGLQSVCNSSIAWGSPETTYLRRWLLYCYQSPCCLSLCPSSHEPGPDAVGSNHTGCALLSVLPKQSEAQGRLFPKNTNGNTKWTYIKVALYIRWYKCSACFLRNIFLSLRICKCITEEYVRVYGN